jgi:hypothetical protein
VTKEGRCFHDTVENASRKSLSPRDSLMELCAEAGLIDGTRFFLDASFLGRGPVQSTKRQPCGQQVSLHCAGDVEASPSLISRITDKLIPPVAEWQSRPARLYLLSSASRLFA